MKTSEEKTNSTVEVLIVYENLAAGLLARELCERLQRRLGRAFQMTMNLNVWNLAALQIPALALAATAPDLRPCILVVAISGSRKLSPPVRNWIVRSARKTRTIGCAIIAQLHDVLRMDLDLAPAHQELSHLAREAGASFFSEAVTLADQDFEECLLEIHRRAQVPLNHL